MLGRESPARSDGITQPLRRAALLHPKVPVGQFFQCGAGTVQEQEAFLSALEPGKAAETLTEPRIQRQTIAHLRKERAQDILASLSTPQLVDLLAVLPHEDSEELVDLLPESRSQRTRGTLSEQEATGLDFMSLDRLTTAPNLTVQRSLSPSWAQPGNRQAREPDPGDRLVDADAFELRSAMGPPHAQEPAAPGPGPARGDRD